ncbi:MAG: PAC2 family protein [Candidatus Omnitrophica bacterium]|nr:PAC2 family protein [Candidatus Omnitrophota bacterium]
MIKNTSAPKLKSPIMLCAWPGMGEVAIKAALYLKDSLPFKEFGRIEAGNYFEAAGIFVKGGVLELPKPMGGVFYYYKNPGKPNDIILFISDAQPNLGSGISYAREIIDFALKHGVKFIYTFAAMTVPIEHTQTSNVWIAVTAKKVMQQFKGVNLKTLNDGQISGLNGLILGVAKNKGLNGACLLGEIPIYTIQIENPKASLAVLDVLAKTLGLTLDCKGLLERAKFVDEEINKLIGYIKGEPSHTGPLSEDEIERIKKELAAFTRLPNSAREKIEALFKLAAEDLNKAAELKKELDTWSVFKDYEDRFLDLFRRSKPNQ